MTASRRITSRGQNQKRIDVATKVVFHPASYNINTATDTVQLRADKVHVSPDEDEEKPKQVDHRDRAVARISGSKSKPKNTLISRCEARKAREREDSASDTEGIRKQLASEKQADVTAQGGFCATTLDKEKDRAAKDSPATRAARVEISADL